MYRQRVVRGRRLSGQWPRCRTAAVGAVLAVLALPPLAEATFTPSTSAARTQGDALPSTIKIGVVTSLTGASGGSCRPEALAIRLAANRANKQRFFGPKRFIKVVTIDDRTTPEGVISGYRQLLSEGVAAILGPCNAALAATIEPQSDAAKVPQLLNLISGAEHIKYKYIFRGSPPQTLFAANTVKVLKARGVKTVVVIHTDDNLDTAELWQKTFKPRLKQAGITVLADWGIQGRPPDINALIAQIPSRRPDAIGLLTAGSPTVSYVNQVRRAGLDQLVFGQIIMAYPAYYTSQAAGEAAGSLYATNFDVNIPNKYISAFVNGWRAENNGEDPSPSAAQGYEGAWRLWRAIKSANSVNREAIRLALTRQKTSTGPSGVVTYTQNGHEAAGNGYVMLLRNGKRTIQNVPK